MADPNSSGSFGILGVIIGALIVIGIGYFIFAGAPAVKTGPTTSVTVEAPKAPSVPTPAPSAPAPSAPAPSAPAPSAPAR